MKASRLSAMFFTVALLVSTSAFAGDTVKKSLHINEDVTVQGVKLAPGDYKVEWTEPGPDVQINILQGKETVATVPARVVPESVSNSQDGYTIKPGNDGGEMLSEIFFTGKKYDLQIEPSNTNMAPGTSPQGAH